MCREHGVRISVFEGLELRPTHGQDRVEQHRAHRRADRVRLLDSRDRYVERSREPVSSERLALLLGERGRVVEDLRGKRPCLLDAMQPGGDQGAARKVWVGALVEALHLTVSGRLLASGRARYETHCRLAVLATPARVCARPA